MLSGISVSSVLLILLIVVLLFGTKKLRNAGSDLGGAIKNFRKAIKEGSQSDQASDSVVSEQIDSEKTQDAENQR